MDTELIYPCPCCGYMTLTEKPPGTYLICPICFWEDDDNESGYGWGGSNHVSLRQAQLNFIAFGACEQEWLGYVRRPNTDDVRVPNWQTIETLGKQASVTLIEKITAAFDGVKREDGISLHAARALDDWHSMEEAQKIGRQIDCDRKWQDVPEQWIAEFCDVFAFFDPKGFRYYIPAYMVWGLKHYQSANLVCTSYIVFVLTDSDSYYREHLRLLNEAQLQVVKEFLDFMATYSDY